jgi:hypothetical protein
MKTYAVWLLISWHTNQGFVIHQPFFPTPQECEYVRKNAEEISNGKFRCVRSDVLQTVDHVQTK